MFSLTIQDDTLTTRPYIALLKETNVRRGFFERELFQRVTDHLPAHMRGIAEFAFMTGWRTPSEILPLEWRQVDLSGGEVRLDPGSTKDGEGRVFPLTADLRRVLALQQQQISDDLNRHGTIARYVFC